MPGLGKADIGVYGAEHVKDQLAVQKNQSGLSNESIVFDKFRVLARHITGKVSFSD